MAMRKTGKQILQGLKSGGGNIDWKEAFVNLKVDKNTGETSVQGRIIGYPLEYYEAQPRMRDENDPKVTKQVPFPDAHLNKSFTRICEDDLENDPWMKMGYIKTRRFAVNMIIRQFDEDGVVDEEAPVTVKILNKGSSIFGEFYKLEEKNREYNEKNAALISKGKKKAQWMEIGGEIAPDVVITAKANSKALGGVEYEVFFDPDPLPLDEKEIEALRAVGCPTDEELEEIRASNPELEDCPDWYFYGYDLEKIFKPTPPKTEDESTPASELDMDAADEDDDDEVEEVETPKSTEKKTTTRKKNTPKVEKEETEEEDDEVEEDEDSLPEDLGW